MNNVLQNMLSKYEIKNSNDETNAIKEIIQEIVICGLSRGGFFKEAAFYGGTALRIFYNLDRFSEDLDFALVKPNKSFDFSKYFKYIEKEAKAYNLNIEITEKQKTKDSNIMSAFLKGDTKEHVLMFFPNENMKNVTSLRSIKIKLEIDINPPMGATYELKYKLLPSPHQIKMYDESSLFASKIHAILCRNWGYRTKGRDLYDYVFYLSRNTKVNLILLKEKLIDSKVITREDIFDIIKLKKMLQEKFENIDYSEAKEDILPFIANGEETTRIWCKDFFNKITESLK